MTYSRWLDVEGMEGSFCRLPVILMCNAKRSVGPDRIIEPEAAVNQKMAPSIMADILDTINYRDAKSETYS